MEQETQKDIANTQGSKPQEPVLQPLPINNPKNKSKIIILLLIITIAAFLLSVSMWIYIQNAKSEFSIPARVSSTPSPTITPTSIPKRSSLEWTLYKNQQFRYQVQYPQGWKVIEAKPRVGNKVEWSGNILLEEELQKVTFSETEVSNWQGNFQINVLGNPNNDTLEMWIDKNKPKAASGVNLLRGLSDEVLDSNPAKRLSIFGFDREIIEVVVLNNGQVYKLSFDGDNPNDLDIEKHREIYEKIITSFKFIDN